MIELLIGALIALVSGVVTLTAVVLTQIGQRRLWHVQETMKAYAALFPAGEKEIRILQSWNLGALVGNERFIRAAKKKLPARIDSPFLQVLTKCWLLEKDPQIRAELEEIETGYDQSQITCWERTGRDALSKRRSEAEDTAEKERIQEELVKSYDEDKKEPLRCTPDELFERFKRLRKRVGAKYFHSRTRKGITSRISGWWRRRR